MSETLIKQYDKLIYKISGCFYGVNKEDLIQSGYLGLIKAYKKYDKSKGTKFSTFAYNYIYGEMYETYSKNKDIKINKKCMKVYKDILTTKEKLSQKYNREISFYETCKYLKLDISKVKDILNSVIVPKSIESDEINIPYEEEMDNKILLSESISSLDDLERSVIEKRFLNDYTQEETARYTGLSQAKVSRIESRSKTKLKKYLSS